MGEDSEAYGWYLPDCHRETDKKSLKVDTIYRQDDENIYMYGNCINTIENSHVGAVFYEINWMT